MQHEPGNGFLKIPTGGRLGVIVFVINFLLVFANLYLSNGYVSKASYESDQKETHTKEDGINRELRGIAIDITKITDHMEEDARQNEKLKELDERTRELERKK